MDTLPWEFCLAKFIVERSTTRVGGAALSPQMLERVCCGPALDRLVFVAEKMLVGAVVSRLGGSEC